MVEYGRSWLLFSTTSVVALLTTKVLVDYTTGTHGIDLVRQSASGLEKGENMRPDSADRLNSATWVRAYGNSTCSREIYNVPASNRVLIHIGKCGGATIKRLFNYRFQVHVSQKWKSVRVEQYQHPRENDHLIVNVRDPIDRLISAWYWDLHYFNYVKRGSLWRCWKCPVGSCVKAYYSSFNAFAEDLNRNSDARAMWINGCLEHFKQNYAHYINGIRRWMKTHPCQVHVLRQEHLSQDVLTVFGVSLNGTHTHRSQDRPAAEQLSKKARKNLQELLVQEYEIYHWLLRLNGLSP